MSEQGVFSEKILDFINLVRWRRMYAQREQARKGNDEGGGNHSHGAKNT
jgi:hypothetical protein